MAKRNSSPARKQPLYRQLVAGIGPEEIATSLAGMENPRADRLLDMIFDPAYASLSFGQLCSRVGLSASEMMRLYCKRQQAVGIMRVAQHLPDLMEQTTLAALDHYETCIECEGIGVVQEHMCRGCWGEGKVRILGDNYRVRLVLEMAGLLPQKAGRR